jgi:hypothetical protein
MGIAVSGMEANTTWLDTTASNVANMNDISAPPASGRCALYGLSTGDGRHEYNVFGGCFG